jgi:hypothetical protein
MQHNRMRKLAAGAGAAALMGIALAGPALAEPPLPRSTVDSGATIPNQGPPAYNTWAGTTAVPNQGPPSYNSWPSLRSEVSPVGATLVTDSGGFDLAPLALGALGGASVAGAAALLAGTALGRRRAIHA